MTPKDNPSASLCINAPVFVDLSNAEEIRATTALATLLGSVLVQGLRSATGVAIQPSVSQRRRMVD